MINFIKRLQIIGSRFFKWQPLPNHKDQIKFNSLAPEIHNDVVHDAINYVQISIRQYYLLFIDMDGSTYVFFFCFIHIPIT